jgi:hypothetical protein
MNVKMNILRGLFYGTLCLYKHYDTKNFLLFDYNISTIRFAKCVYDTKVIYDLEDKDGAFVGHEITEI